MKNRKYSYIIIYIIIISLIVTACEAKFNVSKSKISMEQKIEDFNYMYNMLKETFPYFEVKKRMIKYDWLEEKENFEKLIRDTESDSEFYNVMNSIVSKIQSGHTHILDSYGVEYFKNLYEDPHSAYSPSRRDILSNDRVSDMYEYWDKIVKSNDYIIPILFYYIEGQYVVVGGNLQKYDIPLGSILHNIDNISADEYIKKINDKMYLEYDYKRKKQKATMLVIFSEKNKKVKLSIKTPEGKEKNIEVKEGMFDSDVFQYKESEKNYDLKILEKNKTAYIRLRSMEAKDRFSSDEDGKIMYEFINSIKSYPYLIIDIRKNGGGSTAYWRNNLVSYLIKKTINIESYIVFKENEYLYPFIKERTNGREIYSIEKLPENSNYPSELKKEFDFFYIQNSGVVPYNPINFKGKIYLLVDDNSYSSAEGFAIFAKETSFATLIGTVTGGDGIGADAAMIMLPNSGLVLRYSSVMGINPDGTANEEAHTQPDIYLEQSYDDLYELIKKTGEYDYIYTEYDTVLNYVKSKLTK